MRDNDLNCQRQYVAACFLRYVFGSRKLVTQAKLAVSFRLLYSRATSFVSSPFFLYDPMYCFETSARGCETIKSEF